MCKNSLVKINKKVNPNIHNIKLNLRNRTTMNSAFLSIGTNMGDRSANLNRALSFIATNIGVIINVSPIYETEPWGVTDQPWFYNIAIEIKTKLSPENLLREILLIEEKMGRIRQRKMGERIIDIDILLYENEIIKTETLTVPHPHMHRRNFVLQPLCDIAENAVHPVLKKNVKELLKESSDNLQANKVNTSLDLPANYRR